MKRFYTTFKGWNRHFQLTSRLHRFESIRPSKLLRFVSGAVLALLMTACDSKPATGNSKADPHLQTNGTVEVTAKLLEIPQGAIFKRELYDYATVLKYQVLKVHRGDVKTNVLYIGQYNPFKPRREAADERVKVIGGDVSEFRVGEVHHLALEVPIEDHFMGGIVNKYFGQSSDPIYWAVWTVEESP